MKHKIVATRQRALSEKEQIAHTLHKVFGHAPYAVAKTSANGVSYAPAVGDLTPDLLENHLDGDVVLGSYSLTEANQVWWLGWDVDSSDNKIAQEYSKRIISILGDIPHCVEVSGGKGYHILIFLTEPMGANEAKQVSEYVRELEGLPRSGPSHVECYPKQDKLTPANPLGNLLKIPLGKHPRTHNWSLFVDPDNGWETGPVLHPLEILSNKATPDEVRSLLREEQQDAINSIAMALVPSWQTGERHQLALALSGYLANLGWGLEQTYGLIETICDVAGDAESRNRLQTVTDTYRKHNTGEKVAGWLYLADTLPGAVMRTLSDMARLIATPPIMKKLEALRLGKGANFIKVKESSEIIWTHMTETGNILRTRFDRLYWYDNESHLLHDIQSEHWLALAHKIYGVNPAEAYGKQVLKSLELKALSDGHVVDVHKRSYWDGSTLFLNLGGPSVYLLDGETIEEGFNGECGTIFMTHSDPRNIVHPNLETRESAWDYLVNDVSFTRSEDATASPEEQRELFKAWILSFFFPQLMDTKPILSALGAPGSGKTSTMRRIVRVLEGPREDVISLSEDKPDSLRASIENHKLLVLDNLEQTKANWLVNLLNTLSTGSAIELRQLFKTNELYRIEPDVYVALTAVDVPFSESTLHSRLLPLELSPVQHIIPESAFQRKVRQSMESIWGSLIQMLSRAVAEIRQTTTVTAPVQSRLADFTVFCARIADMGEDILYKDLLHSGLVSLVDRQRAQMLRASPIIEVLEDYVENQPEDAKKWHTYGDLVQALNAIAKKRSIWLDRVTTASALSRHLQPRLPALQKLYGTETRKIKGNRGRVVEQIRFPESTKLDFTVKKKKGEAR